MRLISLMIMLFMIMTVTAEPVSQDSRLQAAIELRKQGQFSGAIAELKQLVDEQPHWSSGHLELAVNYFKLNNLQQAKYHIKAVIADDNLTQESRVIAESLLSLINEANEDSRSADLNAHKAVKAHVWPFSFSLGGGYDSNANIGPDDAELDVEGFSLVPDALQTSDEFLQINASMGHSYRRLKPLDWGVDGLRFSWHSRLSLYAKEYRNLERYDLSYAVINSGPQFYQAKAWQIYLPLQYLSVNYGGDKLVDYVEFNPFYSFFYGADSLSFKLGLTNKSYDQRADQLIKDGWRYRLGVNYKQAFSDRQWLRYSLDLTDNQAESDQRSYQSWRFSLAYDFEWKQDLNLFSVTSIESFSYQGAE